MAIPSIASYTNQPTLTNPLPLENKLQGQTNEAKTAGETKNTLGVQEQSATSNSTVNVVNQIDRTNQTNTEQRYQGNIVDVLV